MQNTSGLGALFNHTAVVSGSNAWSYRHSISGEHHCKIHFNSIKKKLNTEVYIHPSTDLPVSSGLRTVKGLGSRPTLFGINSLRQTKEKSL